MPRQNQQAGSEILSRGCSSPIEPSPDDGACNSVPDLRSGLATIVVSYLQNRYHLHLRQFCGSGRILSCAATRGEA
jgi:hypothetical protein